MEAPNLQLAMLEQRLGHERQARLEAEQAAEQAAMHALHDPLTELANRKLFMDRLWRALEVSRRTTRPMAVFFLDLDGFKLVNDNLGHKAGDQLLIEIAARLKASVRPYDTVARIGGDEFTVMCEDMEDGKSLAGRMVEAIEAPMTIDDTTIRPSASIGVVTATAAHWSPDDLVRDADTAMYAAKQRGRGNIELFDVGMRERVAGRLELEGELRAAIEREQIEPFYQPIVDLATGAIAGFEALARWRHPSGDTIEAAEFIPICLRMGLTGDLGRLMLRAACADLRSFDQQMHAPPWVSVNVSPAQLSDFELASSVAEVIRESNSRATSLVLEITEDALMSNADTSIHNLEELSSLGVRIALDDFGTGYSSLARLRELPIDILKIDRSFATGLGTDPADMAIVKAILGLAQALELTTVTEGLETDLQLDALDGLGCDLGQGNLLGRPLPAREVAESLVSASAA